MESFNLKGNQTMKTTFRLIGAVATVAALFASCKKEAFNEEVKPGQVEMTIIAGADDTKTVLGDGGVVTWADSGEKLAVIEQYTIDEEIKVAKAASNEASVSENGAIAKFTVSLDKVTADTYYNYYALYPNSSYVDDNTVIESFKVELPSTQAPTATSFGPAADILVSKPITGQKNRPEELNLQFARVVAIGKMAITNLNSTENVQKVTFTATGKTVTGRSKINMTNASGAEYGYSNYGVDNVVLDYSDKEIDANGMTAYFTCWPFKLAAGDTFSVEVETENYTFTKNIKLAADKSLAFKVGEASEFSVNFDGIKGVKKSVDVTYAKLTFDEISSVAGSSWGAYTKAYTYEQIGSGLKWVIAAYYQNGNQYIQVGTTSSNRNSYIKLPDFSDDIRTVNIVLKSSLSKGKKLYLSDGQASNSDEISSVLSDGSTKELTIDLSAIESKYKTAYLRTNGTAQVSSVEVFVGPDTRSALETPTVTASLNKDDENVTNSIDVAWNAVANAGSYMVTATPTEGEAVSTTVYSDTIGSGETPSCTIKDLAYETEYTISVVAKPSATELYKDSEPGVCADKVKTGTNVETGYTLVTSTLTAGTYIIAALSSSTYYFVNGKFTKDGIGVEQNGLSNSSIKSNTITSLPKDAVEIELIADANNEGYYFFVINGNTYLYATASKASLTWSSTITTESFKPSVSTKDNNGFTLQGKSGSKVSQNASNKESFIRNYASSGAYYSAIYFFKKN